MALCTLLWFSKCNSTLGKSDPHSERSSCDFKCKKNKTKCQVLHTHLFKVTKHNKNKLTVMTHLHLFHPVQEILNKFHVDLLFRHVGVCQ